MAAYQVTDPLICRSEWRISNLWVFSYLKLLSKFLCGGGATMLYFPPWLVSYSPLQPFLSRHTTCCVTRQKRLRRRLPVSKLSIWVAIAKTQAWALAARKRTHAFEGWGNKGEPPCLLSPLATSPLACAFYHSLLCSPLGMESLLRGSCRGCWSYNMELCLVGVQMTPRKKNRSRGVGCWYIIILLRGSEAKTCKNYECMR